jgi:hypothetical protein
MRLQDIALNYKSVLKSQKKFLRVTVRMTRKYLLDKVFAHDY